MPRHRNKQPVREVPAAKHGDRQALTELQQAAPLPAPAAPGEGGAPTGVPSPLPPPGLDVFAPSENPGQPDTTVLPPDEYALIDALYARFPNEDLRRLKERIAELLAE
ncbi:MAG: hypothetical protein ACE5F5_11925 [Acidimicrobiia bacterium]